MNALTHTRIDELRRELALTKQELQNTRKALEASEKRCAELDHQNREFQGNALKAVQLLLPEGTALSNNWDGYQEPGY